MKTIEVKDKFNSPKLLKVAPFDNRKVKTTAHRHNGYLELVLLTNTSGIHCKDDQQWAVKAPCVLVIQKDDTHYWELAPPVEGYVLLLKKDFVTTSLDAALALLVQQVSAVDIIYLSESEALSSLFALLCHDESFAFQEAVLKAILTKILESKHYSTNKDTATLTTFQKLISLLQADLNFVNSVSYYANLLHTSPQNLNAICKKYGEVSASQLIATHIIKEAKRLLLYTDNTVAEVGFKVGFSDKSNFSKFFKRQVGITPSEFRAALT